MKPTLLAFFVLAICTQVSGQMNKFNIGLEYSPNFTSVSQPYGSPLADSDLGSFYISPEVGIGWNVSNRNKSYWYYTDGSELESDYIDKDNIDNINETTYPLFLSIGNEIRMKSYSILLGVKGYYSLNSLGQRASNAGHYYGFGVVTGVRF